MPYFTLIIIYYHVKIACYQYSRSTSNYLERITLFDLTHIMSVVDPIDINVKTPRIDSGYYLKK